MELERKIERLLRAYAKKRRAEAGDAFKLHPVARRRLQDEVARRPAEPVEEDSVSLWQLFRRQWAALAGFALLMFLGAALFLPSLSKAKMKSQKVVAVNQLKQIGMAMQLAAGENNGRLPATLDALTNHLVSEKTLTDPVSGKRFVYVGGGKNLAGLASNSVLAYSAEEKKARAVLLADGAVQTMSPNQFDDLNRRGLVQPARPVEVAAAERKIAVQNQLGEDHPSPSAPMAVLETLAINGGGNNFAFSNNGAVAGQPAEPPASAVGSGVLAQPRQFFKAEDRSKSAELGLNNNSQRFVQTVDAAAKIPPLLASFEFQQDGSAISVVDSDGSIYHGSLQSEAQVPQIVPPTLQPPSGSQTKDSVVAKNEATGGQNVFFRVAGQNRTSKQNVVFVGNLIPLAATSSKSRKALSDNNSGAREESQAATIGQPEGALINNSRIAGTLTVDTTNQIEINAVPVNP